MARWILEHLEMKSSYLQACKELLHQFTAFFVVNLGMLDYILQVNLVLNCTDTRIRIPVRDTAILRYAIFPKMQIRGYDNIYKK